MDQEYLSIDQMASEYSISRSTAWKWVRDRGLQTYRFIGDRKTYVKRDDLKQLSEPMPIQKKTAA